MGLIIYILQLLFDNVCIYLRGADIRVTQHLLNGPQIGAVFQQVYGKGMAQGVGGDILLDARFS